MPTVLYYDPDPVRRDQARHLDDGTPGGLRVRAAGTFEEAARFLSGEAIDAVVTDPPGGDAFTLLSLTRELAGPVPFVLFMAPGREKTALEACNSGASWYFERPADDHGVQALSDAINHALSLRPDESSSMPRDRYLEFLSVTALDFAAMDDEEEIFAYVAERVLELVPRSFVGVTSFDPATRLFTVRAFAAPPDTIEVFRDVFGQSPVGWQVSIDAYPSSVTALHSQAMIEAPPDFAMLTYQVLPEEDCRRIDARLGPGRAFCLGFECRRGCVGSVVIRLLPGGEFPNPELVEAIVHQASTALFRSRIRRELDESEARYRAVVEAQHELICRFTPDGTLLVANEAFCRFFGCDPGTVIGTRFVPELPNGEEAAIGAFLAALTPRVPDGTFEHRVVRHDGEVRWLQWEDRAFFDEDERVVEFQSVGRDVTDRRTAEEALASLAAELERRVEASTAELRAANHDLEQFSHQVSHDLRAPLRAIDGHLGILMARYGSDLPADAAVFIGRARGGVLRADRFLDGLLSLSRLSHRTLRTEVIDTGALVRDVVADLVNSDSGRTIEVAVGPLPPCRADPELLRHVFENLVANALKFTRGRDPARIEVSAAVERGETAFSVADNGIGFPPAEAGRIFDDFVRLHGDRDFEGSGIGLALVRRVVERHGGRCWAEGDVDRGATFSFTLEP